MKRFTLLLLLSVTLFSCGKQNVGTKYYHDEALSINQMKNSSILLLPVKFFNVKNDVNNRFKMTQNDFNIKMAGIVVSEMGRLGFNKAFIFNQQKNKELSLFLDIADLAYIAGKTDYNDISNISSFTNITKKEGIDYVIFTRTVDVVFVPNEKTQNINKVQDGDAEIIMEVVMFDVNKKKIIKQVVTRDFVSVLDNAEDVVFSTIKNRVFDLFLHTVEK